MTEGTVITPINANNLSLKGLRFPFEYARFACWIATPKQLRRPATQREFASEIGIGDDVLSDWKRREGFWEEVRRQHKYYLRDGTAQILHAFYLRTLTHGRAQDVRLWLQFVEDWTPKSKNEENKFFIVNTKK